LLGDFDIQEHLQRVAEDLCALAAKHGAVRAIAVYPDGMEDVLLYDGRFEHSTCDREVHRKLIDALGGMLGRYWFVIDCQTGSITLDEIETARRVVRGLNRVED
jgi:hypothetical protein